ncbi:MAG TPA: glycosyltransferase family 39 protein [Phycisphaerae bacterium]|nr:glycosyltransferase family 39 protein [Phycisphaerae bacterium]
MVRPDSVIHHASKLTANDLFNPSGGLQLLRRVVWFGAASLGFFTVVLIVGRIGVNFDHEWVESTVVRSIGRILDGKGMYPPPSADFVGDGYPPFFHYFCAAICKLGGNPLIVCRVVSVLCTLLIAAALYRAAGTFAQPAGGSLDKIIRTFCPLLFGAGWAAGGQTFDLARVDMLGLALTVWAAFVALHFGSSRSAVLAGLLIACAIVTKHNMVIVGGAIGVALLVLNWRHALIFGAAALVPCSIFFWLLNRATDGWSGFHLFQQLAANEFGGQARWIRFIARDVSWHGLLLFILLAATVAAVWMSSLNSETSTRRRLVGLLSIAVGGLALTISGRLKIGGYPNNLVPAWTFALFSLAATLPYLKAWFARTDDDRRRVWSWTGCAILGGIVFSLATTYSELPLRAFLQVAPRKLALAELRTLVDKLARHGSVWIPAHAGALPNAEGYAHLCPAGFMIDAANFPIKSIFTADVIRRLAAREWAAIILDSRDDRFISEPIWQSLAENYRELSWPLGDPDRLVSLSGKITAPRRLFVRK